MTPIRLSIAAAMALGLAARADLHCPDSISLWQVGRGELFADRRCGSFLLTTDAENHAASTGEVSWKRPVRLPFEVSVRWRRLGPEGGRAMWLTLVGGEIQFKNGAVGLWINPAQFQQSGFQPLPGFSVHEEHVLGVTQTREAVKVRVDGKLVAAVPLKSGKGLGRIGIGFEGARGYRSFLAFSDFAVRQLPEQ